MPGWAINLHHQLLEERERNAEPPGELRKGFPSRWTSKELSLSRSTSCVRPSLSEKKTFDCCLCCLEFVLVTQVLLVGHNTLAGAGAVKFRGRVWTQEDTYDQQSTAGRTSSRSRRRQWVRTVLAVAVLLPGAERMRPAVTCIL